MRPPARETLTVFWDSDGGQEEMPGFIVYGLVDPKCWVERSFPLGLWPAGTDAAESRLYGESWEVKLWDVRVQEFLSGKAWTTAVRGTLQTIIDAGCRVAWVSSERFPFVDPPFLFLPEHMSGSVLSALTSDGDFFCPLDPDQPIRAISDDQLVRLRVHADGLADAIT
ncbi:hypothetical protein [Arthrobacter sp. YN]|uniref:hypothetical protein n=1 Tax=Arthrobacter sp. YN TaxID=2020486 RepID=UPI0012FD97AB|nr:hypothetical protein [Arthrobacter sp. YN]